MRVRSTILGFAVLVVLLTAGTAQSLSGSNTVFTDDIAPGAVNFSDIHANAVTSSRIADGAIFGKDIAANSVTGADVNEATLALRKHFTARVKGVGTPVVVDGAATSVVRFGAEGSYRVTFPFNVGACTATANAANFPGANSGFVLSTMVATDVAGLDPKVVEVSTTGPLPTGGADFQDSSFVLDLSCP